jgi:stress-induced-phosphoprotein 1
MKDFKRAKDTYEKGLEIDPNNQEIIQGLEKVRSGIFTSGGESETE